MFPKEFIKFLYNFLIPPFLYLISAYGLEDKVTYLENDNEVNPDSKNSQQESKNLFRNKKEHLCKFWTLPLDEIFRDAYQKMGCREVLGQEHPMGSRPEKEIEKISMEKLFKTMRHSYPGCDVLFDSLERIYRFIVKQEKDTVEIDLQKNKVENHENDNVLKKNTDDIDLKKKGLCAFMLGDSHRGSPVVEHMACVYQKMGCSEVLGKEHPIGSIPEEKIEKVSMETFFQRMKSEDPACKSFYDWFESIYRSIVEREKDTVETDLKKNKEQNCEDCNVSKKDVFVIDLRENKGENCEDCNVSEKGAVEKDFGKSKESDCVDRQTQEHNERVDFYCNKLNYHLSNDSQIEPENKNFSKSTGGHKVDFTDPKGFRFYCRVNLSPEAFLLLHKFYLLKFFTINFGKPLYADFSEIGFIFILFSMFIKVSAAPFHLWSLDVYEGSPTASTIFFAIISKLSLFVMLTRVFHGAFKEFQDYWQFYIFLIGVFSIFVGSFGGLTQRKLKTLLAYSSISSVGYCLVTFGSTIYNVQNFFFYMIIYMITSFSIWSIFLALRLKNKISFHKYSKELGDFLLVRKLNPSTSFSSVLTLFSMASIPPMLGFVAKINLFLPILVASRYIVALYNMLTSVVSAFYYVRIIKVSYFENSSIGYTFYPSYGSKIVILSVLIFLLIFLFVKPSFLFMLNSKAGYAFFYAYLKNL